MINITKNNIYSVLLWVSLKPALCSNQYLNQYLVYYYISLFYFHSKILNTEAEASVRPSHGQCLLQ